MGAQIQALPRNITSEGKTQVDECSKNAREDAKRQPSGKARRGLRGCRAGRSLFFLTPQACPGV
jgi:hypothetical protein